MTSISINFFLLIFLNVEVFADEPVDFSKIRNVLKNDMLLEEVEKKKSKQKKIKRNRRANLVASYNLPKEKDFWSFFSEYWMVKNAEMLKWDFPNPDYGLGEGFRKFLEQLGVRAKKIKILLINTTEVAHFALPSNPDEHIFLLSTPFMKSLDLSKLEIYILLFEDYLRAEAGYFKNFISDKEIKNFFGKNFYRKKFKKNILEKLSGRYKEMIFKKGFTFKQQYQVTKQMMVFLKDHIKIWNAYSNVLKKTDDLVKSNKNYRGYLKIYPSPELQLGWLNGK